MAEPLIAGLPPWLNLKYGYQIRFNALDPTTGNPVSGVVVTNPTLYVENLTTGADAALQSGQFILVAGPSG